jgi:hypothetical protein
MFEDRLAVRRFGVRIAQEAHPFQSHFLARGKDEVIGPFEEVGAGLDFHALGELAGRNVPFLKGGDLAAQECFGVVCQRPVEGLRRWIRLDARRAS